MSRAYKAEGMYAYSWPQQQEFSDEEQCQWRLTAWVRTT